MQDSVQFSPSPHQRGNEGQRYKKLSVLGEGSMGKAYLVLSAQDSKQYVMKRINIGHLNEKQKQSALRQAHLHSLFTHPNIIQLKQVYQTTGQKLCIIMQYAEGGDLQQFIQAQNGKLIPQNTVLNMFIQLCLGIQEVHAKRIVHRDIKTANIFLTSSKQLKIGDFGISKSLDKSVLAATGMIGTPYYLSPEMVEGKPYSTKADIWALGVILYQLCSLRLPFEANSLPVLALKILKGSFPPVPNQYSKDLKALILQMLQVDQKKRPSIQNILQKHYILKLLPQDQRQRQANKQEQKKQIVKEKQKRLGQQKDKTINQEKQQKEKAKKEAADKREELRRQMAQDIKKKRKQKDYESQKVSTNNTLDVPSSKLQVKKSPLKSPKKDVVKAASKFVPQPKQLKKEQQETIKPWKVKKPLEKKEVTIQMFVPELKPKQPLRQQPFNDFKVEIYQGKRPDAKSTQFIQPQIKQQGRKSMPLISPVQNYHFNQSKAQEAQIQQSIDESYEQEYSDSQNGNEDILDTIKNLNSQLAKKLPNLSKSVCLYEQSQNFDSTVQVKAQPRPQQIDNLYDLLNSDSLQQLRLLLQQKLGESKFMSAYTVVKQHLDSYYEMLGDQHNEKQREILKQKYVFNKNLLRQKLNFLTEDQFQKNIDLLYTLLMYEDLQMQKNQMHHNEPQQSKYSRLI